MHNPRKLLKINDLGALARGSKIVKDQKNTNKINDLRFLQRGSKIAFACVKSRSLRGSKVVALCAPSTNTAELFTFAWVKCRNLPDLRGSKVSPSSQVRRCTWAGKFATVCVGQMSQIPPRCLNLSKTHPETDFWGLSQPLRHQMRGSKIVCEGVARLKSVGQRSQFPSSHLGCVGQKSQATPCP